MGGVIVGASAGQIVPHAHFHVIPRFREFNSASMFGMGLVRGCGLISGKGQREELDDDEGAEIARQMKEVVELEKQREKEKAKL